MSGLTTVAAGAADAADAVTLYDCSEGGECFLRAPFMRGSELYPDDPLDGYVFFADAGAATVAGLLDSALPPVLHAASDGDAVVARDFLGNVALLVSLAAGHCFALNSSGCPSAPCAHKKITKI